VVESFCAAADFRSAEPQEKESHSMAGMRTAGNICRDVNERINECLNIVLFEDIIL
jgi:hypothetical protein